MTSLLNELPYEPRETWLLPQAGMFCVLRYEEGHLGHARNEDEATTDADEGTRQGNRGKATAAGHPPLARISGTHSTAATAAQQR